MLSDVTIEVLIQFVSQYRMSLNQPDSIRNWELLKQALLELEALKAIRIQGADGGVRPNTPDHGQDAPADGDAAHGGQASIPDA